MAHQNLVFDFLLSQKTDHTQDTFFKDIVKLPASHHLIYNLKNHHFQLHRYYELKTFAEADPNQYIYLLEDAIKLRLRSDVPVGTCLSGGLDSSSVASIASSLLNPNPLDAITAISEYAANDESPFAQKVVTHCHLNWHTTTPRYQDFLDTIEHVMWTQEEPFSSPSICMQYFVMQTARQQNIPVLLDGQGGDETLLGYERYHAGQLYNLLRTRGVLAFMQATIQAKQYNQNLTWLNTAKFMFGTHAPKWRHLIYKLQQPYLTSPKQIPEHLFAYSQASKDLFSLQKLELESTNLPALLRFEDKNSMAHSIETRLPFLDYRLVELALNLKFDAKIYQGWSKWILRQGIQHRLPEQIVWRKNKFGFEAPEAIWLRQHQNIMQQHVLDSSLIASICKTSHLKTLFPRLNARIQWRLYTLALWEKTFNISGWAS
jgi:asparagine synthase (glutamine-hydrolysing)